MEKRVNPRYSPSEARNSKAIQQTNVGILGERDIDKLMLLWNLSFIKRKLIDFLVSLSLPGPLHTLDQNM